MSDLDTLERYRKALLQVIDLGDGCMCDRHGGCGCGHAAANIARDALNPPKRAKPAPRQPRAHPPFAILGPLDRRPLSYPSPTPSKLPCEDVEGAIAISANLAFANSSETNVNPSVPHASDRG